MHADKHTYLDQNIAIICLKFPFVLIIIDSAAAWCKKLDTLCYYETFHINSTPYDILWQFLDISHEIYRNIYKYKL